MVGYVIIVALSLWLCLKTGSLWAVLGSLAVLGVYAFVRKAIQMANGE